VYDQELFMKTKYTLFILFLLPAIHVCTTYSNNVKTKNYQYLDCDNEFNKEYKNPFFPVEFTPNGLNNFFTNIYNKHWYGQEFLPSNFSHMIQFLQYGKKTKQTAPYLKSVLKLFGNKLKASSYVNSYALLDLLDMLPNLTQHYFTINLGNIFEQNKKTINDLMYNNFLSDFSFFKKEPKKFLHDLSTKIIEKINKESNIIDTHVNLEHVRQSLVRFLEQSVGKLIWSPKDHANIWEIFYRTTKKIAELSDIAEDMDNLDDLYWSLVHRFCFFLDLTGHEMPAEFYKDFRIKLAAADLPMFQIAEQEQAITNKENKLMQALLEGEARSMAYKEGLITR